MKKLIVNADDFGFNREITDGIVESHHNGIVTSTTLMANMSGVEYAVERAKDCPEMSVGLHLNFTLGRPLSDPQEVPSLVQENGQFLDRPTFFKRANLCQLDASHLRTEMCRQLEKVQDLGLTPTHVDSHHHSTSCLQPFLVKLGVLKEYGIQRMRTHSGFYRRDSLAANRLQNSVATMAMNLKRCYRVYYEWQHWYARHRGMKTPDERLGFTKIVTSHPMGFNLESVPIFLAAMPEGVFELCCHPGKHSDDPLDNDKMRRSRPKELLFLTDPELRKQIDAANVELISFRAIG